jgi:OPT family oligopeptide transporter
MMTCECLSSLGILLFNSIPWDDFRKILPRNSADFEEESTSLDINLMQRAPSASKKITDREIPTSWWVAGLILSSIACVLSICFLFGQKFYEPFAAVLFAFLVSLLSVRALGETDLNPVSGIGKLSQIFFGIISPGNVVGNIIAGAIAEAGAMQAGDIMQTFKTGYLLKTSPRAQYFGTLIGTGFSVIVSIMAYQLYTKAYGVPSEVLPAPTAQVWIEMAQLMNGGKLAPNVIPFCVVFGVISAILPILSHKYKTKWIPSGVAMAIGMYVTPNWTLARVLGSVGELLWHKYDPQSHSSLMIVVASGFVLGEGVMSIVAALLKNYNVASWA